LSIEYVFAGIAVTDEGRPGGSALTLFVDDLDREVAPIFGQNLATADQEK
jgi:hypothetical protein